jgi:hypothetical protein
LTPASNTRAIVPPRRTPREGGGTDRARMNGNSCVSRWSTSPVPSVDPLSTISQTVGWIDCERSDSANRSMFCASLRAGVTTA